TAGAMLFYPGGTASDPATSGYSFFTNFFSDLGRTQARNGQMNAIAAPLFFLALSLAGASLIAFSLAFAPFFTRTWLDRALAWLGALAGIVAGACFIGLAFTPANLDSARHTQFVYAAFEAFTAAAILYSVVLERERRFPKRFAVVFGVFAVLLLSYLGLLFGGPSTKTPQGVLIQATGQKIIVYASIVSVLIQSLAARSILRGQVERPK
ncbi:MAG: DUF998 domain-containing protein, partial [Chloroflexota bacterium]